MGTRTAGERLRFLGHIAGTGSASGVRVVVGRWHTSPWGPFADVMVEQPDGRRVLLAPDDRVADFVSSTYTFDDVRIEPVEVTGDEHGWSVRSSSLSLDLGFGRRTLLGLLLRLVPPPIARAPWWSAVTDLVARVTVKGVRTRGRAGDGTRTEYYGATDHHALVRASGTYRGQPLDGPRPVEPPPRFGFSSTTRRPSVTTVVTTVELAPSDG